MPVVLNPNDPVGLGGFSTSRASRRRSVPSFRVWRPSHQRKRIQVFRDGGRESGVCRGGGTDLLESRHSEDRQHRSEGIGRQARHCDSAVLKRGLIEIAPGVANSELVQSRGRKRPVVIADKRVAPRNRMPDRAGGQTSAPIRQRGDRSIVVAQEVYSVQRPGAFLRSSGRRGNRPDPDYQAQCR